MAINRPDSFSSIGKARLPNAGTEPTILRVERSGNITLDPPDGTGNVKVALSVNTAQVDELTASSQVGQSSNGSELLSLWESGSSLTAGKLYYWSSLGQWAPADSGTDGDHLHAVCSTITTGGQMVLRGLVKVNTTFTAGELGLRVYIDNSGNWTTTPSTTSGDWVRIMGYVKDTSGIILLDISNDFYQLP